MTTPPAASRDEHGERVYKIPRPGTGEIVELPSVSRILGLLVKPGLETWKQKLIATTLAARADLVSLAATDSYAAVRQALDTGLPAANLGTSIHALTVKADQDELDLGRLDERTRAVLWGYLGLAEKFGWSVDESEATVANFRAGYGGTLDRILAVPGVGRVIADIKTGGVVYPEVALQLAFYAHAESLWDGENHRPLPEKLRTDVGWVIHLRPEGAHVIPVDLTGAWAVSTSLCCIWRWQQRTDVVGRPVQPNYTGALRDWLVERVRALAKIEGGLQALANVWPAGVLPLKHDGQTAVQLEQISVALSAAERVSGAPFPTEGTPGSNNNGQRTKEKQP